MVLSQSHDPSWVFEVTSFFLKLPLSHIRMGLIYRCLLMSVFLSLCCYQNRCIFWVYVVGRFGSEIVRVLWFGWITSVNKNSVIIQQIIWECCIFWFKTRIGVRIANARCRNMLALRIYDLCFCLCTLVSSLKLFFFICISFN